MIRRIWAGTACLAARKHRGRDVAEALPTFEPPSLDEQFDESDLLLIASTCTAEEEDGCPE